MITVRISNELSRNDKRSQIHFAKRENIKISLRIWFGLENTTE